MRGLVGSHLGYIVVGLSLLVFSFHCVFFFSVFHSISISWFYFVLYSGEEHKNAYRDSWESKRELGEDDDDDCVKGFSFWLLVYICG